MPHDTLATRAPNAPLGPMPLGRAMETVDELFVRAPVRAVFDVVRAVEEWPAHLAHYRYVRYERRDPDGGGIVVMAANRPFGVANWPTWWKSEMRVLHDSPAVRFFHTGGIGPSRIHNRTTSPQTGRQALLGDGNRRDRGGAPGSPGRRLAEAGIFR